MRHSGIYEIQKGRRAASFQSRHQPILKAGIAVAMEFSWISWLVCVAGYSICEVYISRDVHPATHTSHRIDTVSIRAAILKHTGAEGV